MKFRQNMIKRPSKNDSEEEILRMQKEFLVEKRKNQDFQPAAQVVKMNKVEDKTGNIFFCL